MGHYYELKSGSPYHGFKYYVIKAESSHDAIEQSGLCDSADAWEDAALREACHALGIDLDEIIDDDDLETAYKACDVWLVETYGSRLKATFAQGDWSIYKIDLTQMGEEELFFYDYGYNNRKHRFIRNDASYEASQLLQLRAQGDGDSDADE